MERFVGYSCGHTILQAPKSCLFCCMIQETSINPFRLSNRVPKSCVVFWLFLWIVVRWVLLLFLSFWNVWQSTSFHEKYFHLMDFLACQCTMFSFTSLHGFHRFSMNYYSRSLLCSCHFLKITFGSDEKLERNAELKETRKDLILELGLSGRDPSNLIRLESFLIKNYSPCDF